jgi:hypothetical protein
MTRRFLPFLSVFAWLGCSGSQPGPGGDESTLKTETAFCTAWADAACNEEVVVACDSGSRAICVDNQRQACQALVPPGYKSKHAEECVEAVRDAYEDADLTAEELDVVLRLGGVCAMLIDGGLDEGADCVRSTDCDGVNGYECVVKAGQTLGTCQVPAAVDGGRRCSSPESVCVADFYCDQTNCVERVPEGDPCDGDVCAAGLRCAVATGETETSCVPQLANRQPCASDDECVSGLCIDTDPTHKQCGSFARLALGSPLCDSL